jgi:hypothetical protein
MTWRCAVDAHEITRSASWGAARAEATVVVATCERARWLPGLLEALEAQQGLSIEVVVVDDSSTDGTPDVLSGLASTDLPLLALRTARRAGPSAARNAGAAAARTAWLLLTDDDCLPEPTWAAALRGALAEGPAVVQGKTLPVEADHGSWDRSITVASPSGLYETCNLGVDAAAFREVGGFAELGLLPASGSRGFGEDAELGSRLARAGGMGWVEDAVVRHRWVPGTFADHLTGRRRLAGFPALASLVPEVRERLVAGAVLSRRTLVTDVGVLGVAASLAMTSPWPLLAAAPWAWRLVAEAGHRPGRPRLVRAGQLAVADLVGAGALLRGSARSRRLVL